MANAVKFWRRLLGFVLGCAFRLLYLSLRIEVDGESATTQCIIAFWHGEQLCLYGGLPSAPSVAAVSRSRDGELQVGVLRAFGVSAVRGSSSSGSLVVLRQLIRRVRDGFSVLFAVDGPRGPRKRPKLGAFYLSQKLNLPILKSLVVYEKDVLKEFPLPISCFILPPSLASTPFVIIFIVPPTDGKANFDAPNPL